jgi:hypothetical protein
MINVKSGQDTMYWDQAIKAEDQDKFIQTTLDEVQTHVDNKHWLTIPFVDIPEGTTILDYVWSTNRKRLLQTNEVYKIKARLNIHGDQ